MDKTNFLKLNLQHFATPSYPETGLQTVATLDNFKAKSIDFTYRFEENLKDFREALGISRLFPVQSGMQIELLGKPEVTLADGNVAEGDLIPLSNVTPKVAETKEIKLSKYRKSTSGEAIQKYGLNSAIDITDEALIKEVQKKYEKRFIHFSSIRKRSN